MIKNLFKNEVLKLVWAWICLVFMLLSMVIVVWKGNSIEGWIVILVLSLHELDSYWREMEKSNGKR